MLRPQAAIQLSPICKNTQKNNNKKSVIKILFWKNCRKSSTNRNTYIYTSDLIPSIENTATKQNKKKNQIFLIIIQAVELDLEVNELSLNPRTAKRSRAATVTISMTCLQNSRRRLNLLQRDRKCFRTARTLCLDSF